MHTFIGVALKQQLSLYSSNFPLNCDNNPLVVYIVNQGERIYSYPKGNVPTEEHKVWIKKIVTDQVVWEVGFYTHI